MQPPQHPTPEPPVIAGYRDLVRIAVGGFSTVYTAYEETLARTVAVKVLLADVHDPNDRRRFQHECELTGRLTGQANIITVFAAGATADDRFYIAMQYLPRGSLADRLAAAGPMPAQEVLRIGRAVARALEAAHAAGILHRDIKPGNILVSDQGEPVLSDFGIASLIDPTGGPERVDAFTRRHAAPELFAGAPPSARSDIYALGSTLYTLLTGVPPADANGGAPAAERVDGLLGRPDVPAGLVALLRRTLAADPGQRPATAVEVAADLTALLDGPQQSPVAPAHPAAFPSAFPPPVGPVSPGGPVLTVGPVPPGGPVLTVGPVPAMPMGGSPVGPVSPAAGNAPTGALAGGAMAGGAPAGANLGWEPTRFLGGGNAGPGAPGIPTPGRRKRTLVAVLVAAVVLAAVGTVFAMTRGGGAHGGPGTATAEQEQAGLAVTGSASADAPATMSAATPTASVTATATANTGPGRSPAPSGAGPAQGQPPSSPVAPAPPPATPKPTATKPAPPPPTVCTPGDCAGKAYFVADGEHLFVCDEKADGYSAVAWYTRTDVPAQNNEAAERSGAGTCLDHNMNMAEGVKITFKICLEDGTGPLVSCSAEITASA